MKKIYDVKVTCITDNPNITSKVERIEAENYFEAQQLASYNFGAGRVLGILLSEANPPDVNLAYAQWLLEEPANSPERCRRVDQQTCSDFTAGFIAALAMAKANTKAVKAACTCGVTFPSDCLVHKAVR